MFYHVTYLLKWPIRAALPTKTGWPVFVFLNADIWKLDTSVFIYLVNQTVMFNERYPQYPGIGLLGSDVKSH